MPEIEAVYESGVFRPLTPVDLPDQTRVRVSLPAANPRQAVRDILARRYDSGVSDTAARHDEHQP
jgi:predicted DNA-binding antitoxin AbrB/MazE fold protein